MIDEEIYLRVLMTIFHVETDETINKTSRKV